MATIKGIDRLFLMRFEGDTTNAFKIAYQTENSTEESRSYETTSTKDGSVKAAGAYEGSHSLSALLEDAVEAKDYVRQIKEKCIRAKTPKRLEVWEIDRTHLGDDTPKVTGEYSFDVVTSSNISSATEGDATVEIETEIEEGPVYGVVTVTPELKTLLLQINDELEFVQPTTGQAGI